MIDFSWSAHKKHGLGKWIKKMKMSVFANDWHTSWTVRDHCFSANTYCIRTKGQYGGRWGGSFCSQCESKTPRRHCCTVLLLLVSLLILWKWEGICQQCMMTISVTDTYNQLTNVPIFSNCQYMLWYEICWCRCIMLVFFFSLWSLCVILDLIIGVTLEVSTVYPTFTLKNLFFVLSDKWRSHLFLNIHCLSFPLVNILAHFYQQCEDCLWVSSISFVLCLEMLQFVTN